MNVEKYTKESFCVMGKEGSTDQGAGIVRNLWDEANSHFAEVAHLAKKDENGDLVGIWGAMSDFSRSFRPWEEGFSRGLYLAGIECMEGAQPPAGWIKWVIPGFEYFRIECDRETIFAEMVAFLEQKGIALAGAVQDFTCPRTGKNYMLFPIRKL